MNWESAIALQAKEEDLILTEHCKTWNISWAQKSRVVPRMGRCLHAPAPLDDAISDNSHLASMLECQELENRLQRRAMPARYV